MNARIGQLMSTVDELKLDADQAGRRAIVAEVEVEEIQRKIAAAEEELQKKGDFFKMAEIAWSDEKGSLMDRVADFTKILQNKDNEIANFSKSIIEKANKREDSLKSEISVLQQDLQR